MGIPPILNNKHTSMPSVFAPAALLREARPQKGLDTLEVPPVCILDPDGDLMCRLRQTGAAEPFAGWPCYHTELDTFDLGGQQVGIVGRVVGASFAVLVAEELFASGCKLLVSLTSAGQIVPAGQPPYFVVIDRSLRDEGTSYHYAPPSEFAEADPTLVKKAAMALANSGLHGVIGASWTTDAPFRETAQAIEAARSKGILAVEMEAAALYAFAHSAGVRVLCLAHVTNTMGQAGDDFEKGEADGTREALAALAMIITSLEDQSQSFPLTAPACVTTRAIARVEPEVNGSSSPSAPVQNCSMIAVGKMRSPSGRVHAGDLAGADDLA